MRIRETTLRVFGGAADLRVEFSPGLNIVIGDNESGKSTLFNAIRHVLLTTTDLDKRTFKKEMDPFLPRPSGNFAEVSITVESEHQLTVRRRWGADAEEEATLSNGTVVRGPVEVSATIDRVLPVTRATFGTVLLADQAQLDQTARLLKESTGARDEAAATLRAARLAAGGVSPEAFLRLVGQRLRELTGRWDLQNDTPERNRGHNDPWSKGAGTVVKAYYEYARQKEDLEAVLQSESELDAARDRLETTGEGLRGHDAFVSANSDVYHQLNQTRGLQGQISAKEQEIKTLREANREWPVALRDSSDTEANVAAVAKRLATLEKELEAARAAEELQTRRAELKGINAALDELQTATKELEDLPPIDGDAIEKLKSVEAEIPHAEARMSVGKLRASIRAIRAGRITTTADANDARTHDAEPGTPLELLASRYLLIETPDLVLEVESGEERFEDLKVVRDQLLKERELLCGELGVSSAADADARSADRQRALARVRELEREVCRTADASDVMQAIAVRDELAGTTEIADTEAGREDRGGSVTSQAELVNQIREASQSLGAAEGKSQHTRELLAGLTERYGSQDELENLLGETNRQLAELIAQRDGQSSVPEGFASVQEFLGAYERRVAERETAARTHEDARVAYAELVGGQPDQTSEELRQAVHDAEIAYERLRRDAHALDRVRSRAERIIDEMDETVFDPFVQRVAQLVGMATNDAFAPETDDSDPLQPRLFTRTDGRTLPFDLLSQGTKDSLALAVRVALAETVLADGSAPFILDDPLVDMDPARRKAGAALLSRFAESHQVILMTCHPEHVQLFPNASVTRI